MVSWSAKLLKIKGEKRIAVYFPHKVELVIRIRKLPGAKWSQTVKAWHVPDNGENREKFKIDRPVDPISNKSKEVDDFKLWLRSKRYSESTIGTYINALRVFLTFHKEKAISEIIQVIRRSIFKSF